MQKDRWITATQATIHCLTGCAIGEILGMVIGTWLAFSDGATIILAIILAFVFGYSLTFFPLVSSIGRRKAFQTAIAADTISITSMEIVDNAVIVFIPGALSATFGQPLFWLSLAFSLAIAFVVTVPINYWMIGRGKGHAAHNHHDHSHHH